ncbi:hypothetical protein PPERSA_06437 [Pseudocohnilembus persalinus]|uniref:Uncharacterized protein n=1 Tax=Pseudocohnilembus persalinus TaxID=266149 RepID=A0A0V0QRA1_PSEPJ|nr:hypothetical protein PPERSA_06437 [Pseudocohnilembus persalinus]|eukprot:KRX04803.1 hypothetical protein PPERSA_06437 [Pseudocohnilembus persalinus]
MAIKSSKNSAVTQIQKQPVKKNGKLQLISTNDKENENLKLDGLIITVQDNSTYDALYQTVKQEAEEGCQIKVYQIDSQFLVSKIYPALQNFDEFLQKNQLKDEEKIFFDEFFTIDPEDLVVNFECCSGCSQNSFGISDFTTKLKAIKLLLDKGYFLMFSDFSLIALIKFWDENLLGPNPFKQIGTTSSQFKLLFEKQKLIDSPSAQLEKVGDLSQDDFLYCHAMGGTICYTVDQKKADNKFYNTEILTVVQDISHKSHYIQSGKYEGIAGHVLLTYPSKGKILTSMGHWIELMKLETSEQKLFDIAERDYGKQYAENLKQEYDQSENKQDYLSKKAVKFVQQSAPSRNKKTKKA